MPIKSIADAYQPTGFSKRVIRNSSPNSTNQDFDLADAVPIDAKAAAFVLLTGSKRTSYIYYSKKVLHHLIFSTFLINVLYKYTKNIF